MVARPHRIEDADVGRVLDEAAGIARRLVEIDDVRVRWRARVDSEVHSRDESFVGAGAPEGMSVRDGSRPVICSSSEPCMTPPRVLAAGDRVRLFRPFAMMHKQHPARLQDTLRRTALVFGQRSSVVRPRERPPPARATVRLRGVCTPGRASPVRNAGVEPEMAPRPVDKTCAVPRNSKPGLSSSSAECAGPEHPECKEPSRLATGA